MKTKSGKSHFVSELRIYKPSGDLFYEKINFTFTAFNASDYINRSVKAYAPKGYTVEFKNVVNLDEETNQ